MDAPQDMPAGAGEPPPRPRSFSPRELRFTPQSAVRWFSPGVLAQSGLHVGVTSVFGSFLDKRELQTSKPCEPDRRHADRDEIWIDYVADTGDGFEATATVAHQVAKRRLTVAGVDEPLPRGDVLVLGGDEVYPAASAEGYENRLEGPWRAALPWTARDHPSVYAIPGNHDWYDGLTGFMRLFGQDDRWLGGWQSHQTRSYFAVRLPHDWWLWGIDIQSDSLIDEPQLDFFHAVAAEAAGCRLVLATAVPTWVDLDRNPLAYRNLAFLERTLLRPNRIELKLTVAGDQHHYSRYEHRGSDDTEIGPTHKITAGGGGAFLHPTHHLPRRASIGINPDAPDDVVDYEVVARYPGSGRSRLLSLRALLLAVRNPSFLVVPGTVSLALLWTIQFGLRSLSRGQQTFAEAAAGWGWGDLAGGLFRSSASAVFLLVVLIGLWAFAKTPAWAARGMRRYATKTGLAVVHLAGQVVAMVTVALVAVTVGGWASDGWAFAVVASIVAFGLGAVVGATVMGAYLALAVAIPGLHAHANEAFAAARITAYRNFLRMHIDRTGALTVYAVGIDRAVPRRRWRAVPGGEDPEASWIEPVGAAPLPQLVDRVRIA
ncbi:MAG TPA: metallophosphoesterase [Acidimicrobiales bacterium]|nr:metallophosphoesterase [Acidimicrobiales bacterium]